MTGLPSGWSVRFEQTAGQRRMALAPTAVLDDAWACDDPRYGLTVTKSAAAAPLVAFLFAGKGEDTTRSLGDLYRFSSAFRAKVDTLSDIARDEHGIEPRDRILLPEPPAVLNEVHSFVEHYVVQLGLVAAWAQAGIHPGVVAGHSLGEIAAATVAGILSEGDGLRLVVGRARLIDSLPDGGMVAVPRSAEDLLPLLPPGVVVAVRNAPRATVLSGATDDLARLITTLQRHQHPYRLLNNTRPMHSPLMEPIRDLLVKLVSDLTLRPPKLPMLSTTTAAWLGPAESTDPTYWGRQLCQPVLFSDAITLLDRGRLGAMVEIGCRQSLTAFVTQQALSTGRAPSPMVASVQGLDGWSTATTAWIGNAGLLWLNGVDVDFGAIDQTVAEAVGRSTASGEGGACLGEGHGEGGVVETPAGS